MDLTIPDLFKTIGISVLCGGLVGVERQMRGKPAGIRTSIFICLGTSLFIILGNTQACPGTDTTRVLGQVVTGIGFLGAGVILSRGENVFGVTSAAVIWVLAAIGSMIGFGEHVGAIAVALLTVLLLIGIGELEKRLPFLRRGVYARDGTGRRFDG